MTKAKLNVSVPEGTWIHRVSTRYPDAVFRVVAIMSREDGGTALLEIKTPEPLPVLSDFGARDAVTEFELLWKHDQTSMVQVETSDPALLDPVLEAGVPLQTPFEVADGAATWTITTSSGRLSALKDSLLAADIDFGIEYVRETPFDPADQLLTDRQREVLLAATEQGYYDTPRRATLTEVSESLDISKATGSDVLHRAEGKVVSWFMEEYLRAAEPPVV